LIWEREPGHNIYPEFSETYPVCGNYLLSFMLQTKNPLIVKVIIYITIILMLILSACGKWKDNDKEQTHEPAFFIPIDLCGESLDKVKLELLQNGFIAEDTFSIDNYLYYPFLNESEHIKARFVDNIENDTSGLSISYQTGYGHDLPQIHEELVAMGAIAIEGSSSVISFEYGDCILQLHCCTVITPQLIYSVLNINTGSKK
jgi:hypothetical protein